MDAEKIIAAATQGTASLATGYLATLVKELRTSYTQLAGQQAEMLERLERVEKRLDQAAAAFADLRRQVPVSDVRPEPRDEVTPETP